MQNCNQCGFQFHLVSQRFYCCDSSKPVCSVCHRKVCKKCQKPRTNEIVIPRCDKCYSRLYESDLLFQYNCQRYFCSKCLSGIFKDAYDKVTLDKIYDENTEIFVKFSCGHEYPYEQLVGFFQHFCICCGTQYDSGLDYQFNDGVKLCFMCYRYFGKSYESVLINCEACHSIIKNSSKASILQGTDIAICQKCTLQSKVQQKNIQKSRTKVNIKEPQVIKKDSFLNNQPVKISPKKDQTQVLNKDKFQQEKKIPIKNPLTKLLKKPSISQLKKKQQKRVPTDKSNSISVTSRFSNNFEDIDEQITKSLGLPHQGIKLKRHLSNSTYVQQYQIDIAPNVVNDYVKCKRCNINILLEQTFNLYNGGEKINNKKGIVEFSSIKTATSINQREESSYFLCRVCYSRSAERQKSMLSLSGVKSKLQMGNNRPSKVQESSVNMDYLKVNNKSKMRENRSPSPSPNSKQYSLTGSKIEMGQRSSLNLTKQSLLSSLQQKKPVQKQYTRPIIHPVSTQSRHNMSNNAARYMKCDACRDVKKSLIATINQGYLCDDCYYLKNPSSSFFNRR